MSSNEETNTQGQETDRETEDCHWRHHRRRFFWKAPLIVVLVLVKVGLVTLLWNHLVPNLFHLPELDYWHALGLMVLIKLMFGWGHHPMKHAMHKRWHRMSREEREKMREALRKRWEE